jgi:hypothetical protein
MNPDYFRQVPRFDPADQAHRQYFYEQDNRQRQQRDADRRSEIDPSTTAYLAAIGIPRDDRRVINIDLNPVTPQPARYMDTQSFERQGLNDDGQYDYDIYNHPGQTIDGELTQEQVHESERRAAERHNNAQRPNVRQQRSEDPWFGRG